MISTFRSYLILCSVLSLSSQPVMAFTAPEQWAQVFSPSTLTLDERVQELQWFADVAQPFQGMTIYSVAEQTETSYYDSQFLAKVFKELTGIEVIHGVVQKSELLEQFESQLKKGAWYHDVFVVDSKISNDPTLKKHILPLSHYAAIEGLQYTNPFLDFNDLLYLKRDKSENWHQLPNFHAFILYWFRQDWFSSPELQIEFQSVYGYELGVPLNWRAYEDIADFFHRRELTNPNGQTTAVYGHADFSQPGEWLGSRFPGALLVSAGLPKQCQPLVGKAIIEDKNCTSHGGFLTHDEQPTEAGQGREVNSEIVKYAVFTWAKMLAQYAPETASVSSPKRHSRRLVNGDIAQTWYWSPTAIANESQYYHPASPLTYSDGSTAWRVAPVPVGQYWQEGMPSSYYQSNGWTIPQSTEGKTRHAAWLWAQFTASKSVALKKMTVTKLPMRQSSLSSTIATSMNNALGGYIDLLRSNVLVSNQTQSELIPDYLRVVALWEKAISNISLNLQSIDTSLDALFVQLDALITETHSQPSTAVLSEIHDARDQAENTKFQLIVEEPIAKTISYDSLLESWKGENK